MKRPYTSNQTNPQKKQTLSHNNNNITRTPNILEDIPADVLTEITQYLPAKALLNLYATSKKIHQHINKFSHYTALATTELKLYERMLKCGFSDDSYPLNIPPKEIDKLFHLLESGITDQLFFYDGYWEDNVSLSVAKKPDYTGELMSEFNSLLTNHSETGVFDSIKDFATKRHAIEFYIYFNQLFQSSEISSSNDINKISYYLLGLMYAANFDFKSIAFIHNTKCVWLTCRLRDKSKSDAQLQLVWSTIDAEIDNKLATWCFNNLPQTMAFYKDQGPNQNTYNVQRIVKIIKEIMKYSPPNINFFDQPLTMFVNELDETLVKLEKNPDNSLNMRDQLFQPTTSFGKIVATYAKIASIKKINLNKNPLAQISTRSLAELDIKTFAPTTNDNNNNQQGVTYLDLLKDTDYYQRVTWIFNDLHAKNVSRMTSHEILEKVFEIIQQRHADIKQNLLLTSIAESKEPLGIVQGYRNLTPFDFYHDVIVNYPHLVTKIGCIIQNMQKMPEWLKYFTQTRMFKPDQLVFSDWLANAHLSPYKKLENSANHFKNLFQIFLKMNQARPAFFPEVLNLVSCPIEETFNYIFTYYYHQIPPQKITIFSFKNTFYTNALQSINARFNQPLQNPDRIITASAITQKLKQYYPTVFNEFCSDLSNVSLINQFASLYVLSTSDEQTNKPVTYFEKLSNIETYKIVFPWALHNLQSTYNNPFQKNLVFESMKLLDHFDDEMQYVANRWSHEWQEKFANVIRFDDFIQIAQRHELLIPRIYGVLVNFQQNPLYPISDIISKLQSLENKDPRVIPFIEFLEWLQTMPSHEKKITATNLESTVFPTLEKYYYELANNLKAQPLTLTLIAKIFDDLAHLKNPSHHVFFKPVSLSKKSESEMVEHKPATSQFNFVV